MIIDCISDLHGHYPELEGGDLLIIAGDLTARDTEYQHDDFFVWLNDQSYTKKIFIAGNHDNYLRRNNEKFIKTLEKSDLEYLCDSGTEFEGLKIFGSPWTKSFEGMNPKAKAFTLDTEEELAEKWALIPADVDILVTHSPPYGICDYRPFTLEEKKANFCNGYGSKSLLSRISQIDDGSRKILVCGHIHEGYGIMNISNPLYDKCTWKVVNASHVNERYEPVNGI
jgi:Icc-related predicted phosphoesterase